MLLCSIVAAFLMPSLMDGDIRKFSVADFITQNTIQYIANVTHNAIFCNIIKLLLPSNFIDILQNLVRI